MTHFGPTILFPSGGGTNSHVSFFISELHSSSNACFHLFASLPFKASFIDCGSLFSAVKGLVRLHSLGLSFVGALLCLFVPRFRTCLINISLYDAPTRGKFSSLSIAGK